MLAKHLLPFEDNKEQFSKISQRPRKGFKEALVEIVENPKVKWGMRGQEDDEEEEEEQKAGDNLAEGEKSGMKTLIKRAWIRNEVTKPSKQAKRTVKYIIFTDYSFLFSLSQIVNIAVFPEWSMVLTITIAVFSEQSMVLAIL